MNTVIWFIYVLADSQKFQEHGFHTITTWNAIDGIITDSKLSYSIYERYQKKVPIYMAKEDDFEDYIQF